MIGWIRLPREITFGYGSVSYLGQMPMKRVAVISGGPSTTRLAEETVLPLLKKSGKEAIVFGGVVADPPLRQVAEFKEKLLEYGPDWIVGFGGGSPIDLAKCAWIFYEHPELDIAQKVREWGSGPIKVLPPLRRKARLIAVETTSGTGTAVTRGSVITDEAERRKYPVRSYDIVPDLAIYDPEVCLVMPPQVTAHTGMDALTHALETYVSVNENEPAKWLALRAIQYVFHYLPRAYAQPQDREAREKMHEANMMAAMAFSNAGLGICHAHAHPLGGRYHIPHGLANAVLLPHVVDFNLPAAEEKYAEVAGALELCGDNQSELAAQLIYAILRLNSLIGIGSLEEALDDHLGDFKANLAAVAGDAFNDPSIPANPRKIWSAQDTQTVYLNALEGRLVNCE
jgi:alcohol dehydrogenase class IV